MRLSGPQKLGGVTQKSTTAGSDPSFTFQCGSRGWNAIALTLTNSHAYHSPHL
jgi:hypothetical protein